MFDRVNSCQSSDSPYKRSAVDSVEHSGAVAEMATFENMEVAFDQTFSPFVDDDDEGEDD